MQNAPKPPIQLSTQAHQDRFDTIFARELLKSEYTRTRLMLLLSGMTCAGGLVVMTFGHAHFESMGDTGGSRYLLLLLVAAYMGYQLVCNRLLARRIKEGRGGTGAIGILNALVDPTVITIWLLLEGLLFKPGSMFESPFSYNYTVLIFLAALQLSWRLCLLTGLVAGLEYMLLIGWYWQLLHGSLPSTVSSYLPLHGVRALVFSFCGAAAAFIAFEIRKGIEQTMRNLTERDFVVGIFGRYLSDEVVDDILRSPEGLRLGGRRRTVTVMMTDLRGFTSLSESLPPESVIAMLNHCLGVLTEVIMRYQGTIDEFIGDAILAIFGAPFSGEDDAGRAVACALEMQLAMAAVNEWNREQGYPPLEMGIGIHTGPAVVGNIGSEQRSKYGVVGSTVNLTSRIESFTVGGQVLISGATAELLGQRLQIAARRTIRPKGFAEPIEICDVTGITGDQSVSLPEHSEQLVSLDPPLPVHFVALAGKDAAGEASKGKLTALSPTGARLRAAAGLEPFTNLSLELRPASGEGVAGKLLAKITETAETSLNGETTYQLRFTSIGQDLSDLIAKLLAGSQKV
ncbi:MAG: adenylate/guanylate cyclase domain-containing protein [Candidatus Sericytochromatia bacterium]